MKKAEIKVGGMYAARVSGRYVTVRVDQIRQGGGFGMSHRETTLYDITNLTTGRKTTFRSAAKFRTAVNATAIAGLNLPKRFYGRVHMGEPERRMGGSRAEGQGGPEGDGDEEERHHQHDDAGEDGAGKR